MKQSLAVFVLLTVTAGTAWAAPKTVTLAVSNMTCAACPITVKKALSRVSGVNDVSIDVKKKQATIAFDDSKTSISALARATTDAGFPSTPVSGTRK
jgi:mercuric ion binding protein